MANRKYVTHEMIDAILEMHNAKPELTNMQLARCFAVSDGTVGSILRGQHPLQIEKSKQEATSNFDSIALISALNRLNDTLKSMDSSLLLIADALFKDETESDKEDEHESA